MIGEHQRFHWLGATPRKTQHEGCSSSSWEEKSFFQDKVLHTKSQYARVKSTIDNSDCLSAADDFHACAAIGMEGYLSEEQSTSSCVSAQSTTILCTV